MSILSLMLPGSPSVALTTTTGAQSFSSAFFTTALSLRAKGNAAPPWPQVDLLGHGDQFLGGKPGQRTEDVAVCFQVEPGHPVEPGRQPGGPDPHDRRGIEAPDRAHRHSSPPVGPGIPRYLGSVGLARCDPRRAARGGGPACGPVAGSPAGNG